MASGILWNWNGITVAQLKLLILTWPEEDEDGEPTTVWMTTGRGVSSQVKQALPLNKREGACDLLLDASGDGHAIQIYP